MPLSTYFLSALFTSFPAIAWLFLILLVENDAYFWIICRMAGSVLLVASLQLGSLIPAIFPKQWLRRPWLWIGIQGLSAWMIALIFQGILSLTPLCVGQNNGDGHNDLTLCVIQTAAVGLVYSFPELILLASSAIPGGLIVKKMNSE